MRVESGTDFVVVMSRDAIRYTHPDPSQIGKTFIGHTEEALAGGIVEEDYTGTLGPSSRVVVPVTDAGKVVALVSVGIRKSAVGERVRAQLPGLLLAGLVAALLSGLGTALVSRRIRRQTHGLGEQQLREMYEYYDAVLHAVTEGLRHHRPRRAAPARQRRGDAPARRCPPTPSAGPSPTSASARR